MLLHPEFTRQLVEDRIEGIRHDRELAQRAPRSRKATEDLAAVALRLCRASDDPALENLAALDGKEVPSGRLVVAEVSGRIVAALPLNGGQAIRDPFTPTAHLMRLLELRAEQITERPVRRSFLPRAASVLRGAI